MPTKIPFRREAEIVWKNTGGDQIITLASLASAAGRQGARHDVFGALGAKAIMYEYRLSTKFNTVPVLDEIIEIYLATWDEGGARGDNDDGTGDIAVSSINKLKNLPLIGVLEVDEAATGVAMTASGLVVITARYVAPVIWNATADALSATATDHEFSLTPLVAESA